MLRHSDSSREWAVGASDQIMDHYVSRRAASRRLYDRAADVLAGRMAHDLRNFDPFPLYVREGRGSRKWDVDGHEYVDFCMGNGALMLGHAHPAVVSAIQSAATSGTHFGNEHVRQLEWAELLQNTIPCAEKVRFVNSGTEATLLAYRVAQAHTGRSKLLKFEGHFHGWHDHVLRGVAPPFESIPSLGVPDRTLGETVVVPNDDLDRLEQVLTGDGDIAAAILEPSGASWGRVPATEEFVKGVRDLTAAHGVPLIFDEVITGFRWSTGGAQERLGVVPDMACLAKVAAGGMPGGALVGTAEVMHGLEFRPGPKVVHYGTFNASPLTAAAAVATIETIVATGAIDHADALAEEIRAGLSRILAGQGIAGFAYGPSSTFHVYFETDQRRLATVRAPADVATGEAVRLKGMPAKLVLRYQQLMRAKGVDYVSSTGGMTSGVHDRSDVDRLLDAFQETVTTLRDEGLVAELG